MAHAGSAGRTTITREIALKELGSLPCYRRPGLPGGPVQLGQHPHHHIGEPGCLSLSKVEAMAKGRAAKDTKEKAAKVAEKATKATKAGEKGPQAKTAGRDA